MRFLVLSDVHMRENVKVWASRLMKEHHADGAMVLGDITHFGPAEWAEGFLTSLKGKVISIPGNCDPELSFSFMDRSSTYIHGRQIEVEGHTLVGFGGSNPTIFNTPNEMSEDDIYRRLRPIMVPNAIMVLHCPAYGTLDMTSRGVAVGSTAIKRIVEEFHPKVVLSGHIHEDRGIVEKDGTVYMNPGAAKEGHAGLIDIGPEVRVRLLEKVLD